MKNNKNNFKKYPAALALLPIIAACGTAAWLFIKDLPERIVSTHANYVLWDMMRSKDVTASDIARSPYLDQLSDDDLRDLIDESRMNNQPEITAVLLKKLRERKIRG